jgi:hypothetical protein
MFHENDQKSSNKTLTWTLSSCDFHSISRISKPWPFATFNDENLKTHRRKTFIQFCLFREGVRIREMAYPLRRSDGA